MQHRHRLVSVAVELQRRRVFRLSLFYLACGWLLIQVAGTIFPLFGLPAALTRGLVVVIATGFPLAVLLGWRYDLTADGLQRTLPAELDSIAIASFAPVGPDTHGAAGQVSHLIADALQGLPNLRLVANPQTAASIVDGEVEADDQSVELRLRVVHRTDQRQVLAQRFKSGRSLIEVDEQIAWPASRAIIRALHVSLAAAPRVYPSELQDRLDRADALVDGREPAGMEEALSEYAAVLASDADCAPAHAGRAAALALMGHHEIVPAAQAWPSARQAAQRAIQLDPNLPIAHAVLGLVRVLEWDWPGTHRHFRRALELDPEQSRTHLWFALCLSAAGRSVEALAAAERARAAAPGNRPAEAAVATHLLYSRRYPDCVILCESLLARRAEPTLYVALAIAQEYSRDYDASRNALKSAMQMEGVSQHWLVGALGHVDATAGKLVAAQRALQVLARTESNGTAFVQAALCAALGATDDAFAQLGRAADEHDPWLLTVQVHPWIDPLRGDPRYALLLVRLGLRDSPATVHVS